MIKQYFDYKIKEFQDILNSTIVIISEKNKTMEDYNNFLRYFKQDRYGRVIVNKKITEEMLQLVEERKIPLVMDQYDLGIVIDKDLPNGDNNYHFQSISDFIAVHKSPIPPKNDSIITQENSGLTCNIYFKDPNTGKEHSVAYIVGNDTIHFTLNCVVYNHHVGNDWDSYKYAVMLRLDKLDKTKILDVKSEDTFIDGNAELGNEYIIFCPVNERENIQKSNHNALTIEYDGISINEAISRMIIYSGKKLEHYGTYGWERDSDFVRITTDNIELNNILEKEGYPNLTGRFGLVLHSETKYMARRMWKREYEAIISLIEYCSKNNIEMTDEILNMLLMYNNVYALPGNVPVSIETYKEVVVPILEKHGYEIGNDFFEGIDLTSSDEKIIYHYSSGEMMIPSIKCPEWEDELRLRAIKLIKEKNYDIYNKKHII